MSAPVKSRREEFRELMRLAIPIAIAQGGQALMGLVDTLVVGRAGTLGAGRGGAGQQPLLRHQRLRHGADDGLRPAAVPGLRGAERDPGPGAAVAGRVDGARSPGTVLAARAGGDARAAAVGRLRREELAETRAYLLLARAQHGADARLPHGARATCSPPRAPGPWWWPPWWPTSSTWARTSSSSSAAACCPRASGRCATSPPWAWRARRWPPLLCTLMQLAIILYAVRHLAPRGATAGAQPGVGGPERRPRGWGFPSACTSRRRLACSRSRARWPSSWGRRAWARTRLPSPSAASRSPSRWALATRAACAWAGRWARATRLRPGMSGFIAFAGGAGFMALSALVFALFPSRWPSWPGRLGGGGAAAGAPADGVRRLPGVRRDAGRGRRRAARRRARRASPSWPTWWGTTPSACRCRCCWASG